MIAPLVARSPVPPLGLLSGLLSALLPSALGVLLARPHSANQAGALVDWAVGAASVPDPWWLPAILAVVLLGDAVLSIRPPRFIRDCLDGVGLPREWWWTLIVIKVCAAVGLVVGIWVPGVGLAATVGVVGYFLCASIAHLRARFTGREFWINCLGMLVVSSAVLILAFLAR